MRSLSVQSMGWGENTKVWSSWKRSNSNPIGDCEVNVRRIPACDDADRWHVRVIAERAEKAKNQHLILCNTHIIREAGRCPSQLISP